MILPFRTIRRCNEYSDGVLGPPDVWAYTTIVAGEVTYEDGQPTGARPGRLVRFS